MTLKELEPQDYLTLTQASRMLPGRPSLATIHRWRKKGVRGRRLKAIWIGTRVHVRASELADFVAHMTRTQNEADGIDSVGGDLGWTPDREREIAAAEAECMAAGI